jgi:hypothetical protein
MGESSCDEWGILNRRGAEDAKGKEDNRFIRNSPSEAQSFRLRHQPKAAKAALNHEKPLYRTGLEPLTEAFSRLVAGSFELAAGLCGSMDFVDNCGIKLFHDVGVRA